MIDETLLIKLVSIQSSMTDDWAINEYIVKYVEKIGGVTISKDDFGNIYATKGSGKNGYKCIVSHTDTVHSGKEDRFIYKYGDTLFAMAKTSDKYSESFVSQCGIGGDDRCGIYTCIKALEDFDDIKAVFFRFEESGCRGSRASNMSFFDDCNFVVQCDRRGHSDFITYTNGTTVASKEFVEVMKPVYEKFGFKECNGVSTDVGALKTRGLPVCAVNLSSGYYDPHSSKETISMHYLQNTYELVSAMFTEYGDRRFPHEYVKPVYSSFPIRSIASQAISKGKKTFKLGIKSNYFTDVLAGILQPDEITVEESMNHKDFIEIGISGLFKYIGDAVIDMEKIVCPECKSTSKMLFLPAENTFYCTETEHNDYVSEDEMYRHCVLEENGIQFVYNRLLDVWMYKSDAKWDSKLNTYTSLIRNH